MNDLKLLDVVALLDDLPAHRLRRGQVGTIIEILGPAIYDVEFCDDQGRTYALASLRKDQLLPLVFQSEAKVA